MAANHAYIADTTTENNRLDLISIEKVFLCFSDIRARSPTFSLALGLLFAGMGLGPSVGAVLIRYTGKVLSVFYFATSVHFANCIFIMTVIPESLTQKKMLLSRAKYAQDLKDSTQDLGSNSSAFKFLNKFKILFSFLSPLSIFLPAQTESRNPLRKKSRDWSLTLLVISYGFHNLMMVNKRYQVVRCTYPQSRRARTPLNFSTLQQLLGGRRKLLGIYFILQPFLTLGSRSATG